LKSKITLFVLLYGFSENGRKIILFVVVVGGAQWRLQEPGTGGSDYFRKILLQNIFIF
jgi:hypothetical protein